MTKKTVICIIVFVIIFVIGCIDKNNRNILQVEDNHTETDKQISNIENQADRLIILRLDDVQGYTSRNVSIRIIDTVLNKNMSITLGVIPFRNIDNDMILNNYLKNKINDSRIEIAQHGTNHSMNEMLNLNETEAYNKTELGLQKLINTLGVKPITYIPPDEKYNENTIKALSRLGFKVLSADYSNYRKYESDGNMIHVGYDALTKYTTDEAHVEDILCTCSKAIEKKNLCVVIIHPQDYIGNDKNIDENKYEQFIKLLDGLEKLNARSVTFKYLLKKVK